MKVVLTPTSTHSSKDVAVSNVRPTFCLVAVLYLKMTSPLVDCILCHDIFLLKVNFPPSWLLGRGRWWACDLPWSHNHLQDLVQGRGPGLQGLRILKVRITYKWSLFIHLKLFLRSDFPLIFSIENHCGLEQQETMADHLVNILGDDLYKGQPDQVSHPAWWSFSFLLGPLHHPHPDSKEI